MREITGILVGVLVIGIAIVGVLAYQNRETESKGSLYIGITDAAADINGVTEVNLRVNKVEIYNETKGWVTVSSKNKSYELFELRDNKRMELYTEESVDVGEYSKVKVTLGDVMLQTTASASVEAKKPSDEVVINTEVDVKAGEATELKIDFLADKSIHKTTTGEYVFAPVVLVESRNNVSIELLADNTMITTGGVLSKTVTVGVDLDGTSRDNFVIDSATGLKVESGLTGGLTFTLGGKTYKRVEGSMTTETEANTSLTTDGGVNTTISDDLNVNIN